MSSKDFEPYLAVDAEVSMAYFYLAPQNAFSAVKTLEVDDGILIDVNEEDGQPLGVEIFGGYSPLDSQLKLIALGVRPHDVKKLLSDLSLRLDLHLKSV